MGNRKKILVADDMEVFRRYLIKTLDLLGYEAEGVPNIDGLNLYLEKTCCDLVLLDWNIGGSTAIEAVDTLKRLGIPVIVITGDPDGVDEINCPILGKPIHLKDLKENVEKIWSH